MGRNPRKEDGTTEPVAELTLGTMMFVEELEMLCSWDPNQMLEDGQYLLIQFAEVPLNFGFLNFLNAFFVVALDGHVVRRDQAESGQPRRVGVGGLREEPR